jgi:DNA-binding SARP family transcriptional activator
LEAGIEVDYAQQLIRQKKLIPEKPPLHLDNWPWPVKVHTLGRFELLKDEAPIVFSGKAQDKPLALLQALIAFGGRQIPIDQLTDALWPEADGDMAHLRFKTTLHRLRNLIDYPEAIQLKGGHLTLDHRCCWVDVWALQQILEQIPAGCKVAEKDKSKVLELTRRALDLYQGPFLPSKSLEPWIISLRTHLSGKLLQTLQNLAADWEKAGAQEEALACYGSGIKVDPYAENCHQGLIKCYRHLGRQAEALSACNRLKETFAAADIDPSPQTQSLMNAIFSKSIISWVEKHLFVISA